MASPRRVKGAQTCSCSSSVLVQETSEQVASPHGDPPVLTSDGQTGSVRRVKPSRPVWTMPIVVADVEPKDLLQMAAPEDQQPVEAVGTNCVS
jgi:hypothetical protein